MIVDDIEVSYKVSGQKSRDLIVFLQGWATTKEIYDELADYLSQYAQVLQFDFPGFGLTPEPPQSWSVQQYAAFTSQILKSFDYDNLIIVAHSFGGRIAIELAADHSRYNAKIKRMFFIDVAGCKLNDASKTMRTIKYKAIKNAIKLPGVYQMFPELIDEWKSNQGSADYKNASEIMRGVLVQAVNYDQTELLGKINVPVNLIWGENDHDTPIRIAEIMNGEIKESSLDLIENAGHFPFIDDKEAVCEIFRRYLADSR